MRACKIDRNQPEIVKALRDVGCSVQILSAVGKGCPDLLLGWCGKTALAEVKDGLAPASQRKLTTDQVKWHREWRGQVAVIRSIDEAWDVLTTIGLDPRNLGP